MTQDEIIELAKQSGIHTDWEISAYKNELQHFAKLVAKKEREACANIVEENANKCGVDTVAWMLLASNAEAIRTRGQA